MTRLEHRGVSVVPVRVAAPVARDAGGRRGRKLGGLGLDRVGRVPEKRTGMEEAVSEGKDYWPGYLATPTCCWVLIGAGARTPGGPDD